MKKHLTLIDLEKSLHNDAGDMKAADFVNLCSEMVQMILAAQEKAQTEIDEEIEEISDSFGAGITMRQLKGE